MSGPIICLWSPAEHRLEVFIAALSSLAYSGTICRFQREILRRGQAAYDCTVAQAMSMAREIYGAESAIEVDVGATLDTRRVITVTLELWGDVFARTFDNYEPFKLEVHDSLTLEETDDLFARVCASPHLLTWASSFSRAWPAPLEASGTYHADGKVARDLALTWIHLQSGRRIRDIAGLSLDALRARVDATPPGTRVGVATSLAAWAAHGHGGWGASRSIQSWLPGDVELTREQVLAALAVAPETLLEALEASAIPDDEWCAAEARAIETAPMTKGSVPASALDVTAGKDVPWIEQHAPYHVRRLPNGGVMLTTHPYRTLWQLYADALFLLGINPSSSKEISHHG
ncbi:MAG: hypothetical protein ABI193_23655 [Minicystis sp.]